jgi:hypothetical protein
VYLKESESKDYNNNNNNNNINNNNFAFDEVEVNVPRSNSKSVPVHHELKIHTEELEIQSYPLVNEINSAHYNNDILPIGDKSSEVNFSMQQQPGLSDYDYGNMLIDTDLLNPATGASLYEDQKVMLTSEIFPKDAGNLNLARHVSMPMLSPTGQQGPHPLPQNSHVHGQQGIPNQIQSPTAAMQPGSNTAQLNRNFLSRNPSTHVDEFMGNKADKVFGSGGTPVKSNPQAHGGQSQDQEEGSNKAANDDELLKKRAQIELSSSPPRNSKFIGQAGFANNNSGQKLMRFSSSGSKPKNFQSAQGNGSSQQGTSQPMMRNQISSPNGSAQNQEQGAMFFAPSQTLNAHDGMTPLNPESKPEGGPESQVSAFVGHAPGPIPAQQQMLSPQHLHQNLGMPNLLVNNAPGMMPVMAGSPGKGGQFKRGGFQQKMGKRGNFHMHQAHQGHPSNIMQNQVPQEISNDDSNPNVIVDHGFAQQNLKQGPYFSFQGNNPQMVPQINSIFFFGFKHLDTGNPGFPGFVMNPMHTAPGPLGHPGQGIVPPFAHQGQLHPKMGSPGGQNQAGLGPGPAFLTANNLQKGHQNIQMANDPNAMMNLPSPNAGANGGPKLIEYINYSSKLGPDGFRENSSLEDGRFQAQENTGLLPQAQPQ